MPARFVGRWLLRSLRRHGRSGSSTATMRASSPTRGTRGRARLALSPAGSVARLTVPTRQAEFAWGYPAGAPFNGNLIQTVTSTEWYQVNMSPGDAPGTDHLSKYIGSDMTGGSSGGPWWISHRHPNFALEIPDTDGQNATDPVQNLSPGPFINGVNSHKRCQRNSRRSRQGGRPVTGRKWARPSS